MHGLTLHVTVAHLEGRQVRRAEHPTAVVVAGLMAASQLFDRDARAEILRATF